MASQSASLKVVLAALIGNGLISITKFVASFITSSSAMLSEAIHSLVDTGNQGLILYGMKKAKKPADENHPYGYGMELYFWAFIVAILIFAVGAGISIYEGVHKLQHPTPINKPYINYIVLGIAIIFESVAWWIAFKEFDKSRGKDNYIKAIKNSKNPTIFTVLMEDSAAMLGLFIALIGVFCADVLDMPRADGIASISIGAVLALTSCILAYESKGLLIGESASPEVVAGVKSMVTEITGIKTFNEVLTMHLSPNDILLNLSVDFADELSSKDVEDSITLVEQKIKAKYPEIKRIFIEAQSLKGHKAGTSDNI